jgi:hypothetical protein
LSHVSKLDMGTFDLKKFELASVWTIVPVIANFEIETEVHEVAVVYNIPAYSYIINTIWQWGARYDCRDCFRWWYEEEPVSNNQISFTSKKSTQERYSCQPDHYEIRYDRLFLYYDDLPAGAGCEVDFSLIKTHNGVADVLSQELFEMYSPEVWGRNYVF